MPKLTEYIVLESDNKILLEKRRSLSYTNCKVLEVADNVHEGIDKWKKHYKEKVLN